jgi:cellulose synthase/poly-beta-1,6-N-acetylglucosamine synthase-like glycosyltransferase
MQHSTGSYILVCCYFLVLCAIAFYGFHRYILVFLYIKHRNNAYTPKRKYEDHELPRVTIQLPMFNEDSVAERIIRATCQIDYPLDKLEIQVLDDSTDHSAEIAEKACQEWAAKGYPIRFMHRTDRTGYKAGALEEGLKTATGQFIAIFDADFIPPKDILRNSIDYFTDDKVGMVQMRWDHLNRDASLLTKTQAIFLDAHFVIEHTARNRSGRFMHFNGTAGVWRRTTIADAGGWQHDTLTEDLDLSYRAQMKGWQFVYLPQHTAPAELPPEIIAFKQQAHRWTKGGVQTAIKLLPAILRSKHVSRPIKMEAFFHLTNTFVYPMMVLVTLMLYPTFFYGTSPLKDYEWSQHIFSASMFVLATCSASMFFIYGQRELFGREAGWKTLFYVPFLMALGVGVSLNNTKAVFEAIWSAIRRKPSEFVRTQKYGNTGGARTGYKPQRVFTFKRLSMPIIELVFGLYMLCCIYIAVRYQFGISSVPFLTIFASGYFYVALNSIHVLWKMQQEAEDAAEAAAAAAEAEVVA